MSVFRFSCVAVVGLVYAVPSYAGPVISTEFNTSDGFVTGGFAPVTLSNGGFTTTFSGGQQQQMFDGPSYQQGPSGYLFINGMFTGTSEKTAAGDGNNDDKGEIDFSVGVSEVSFFAANRGRGPAVRLNIFGTDDTTLLDTVLITQKSNRLADGATITTINASDIGGLIGSIGIDLPGPAGMPPYVLAIDTFSATAVPEPSSIVTLCIAFAVLCAYCRFRKVPLLA